MATDRDCLCPVYPHPICRPCGDPVTRRSSHVHVFTRGADPWETICGECFAIYATASQPVICAAAELGIDARADAVAQAIKAGHIQVWTQDKLIAYPG